MGEIDFYHPPLNEWRMHDRQREWHAQSSYVSPIITLDMEHQ